jgi:hypothetical protein
MSMYFLDRPGAPTGHTSLGAAARAWAAQNPQWQFRHDMSLWPPSRPAGAQEVAEAIVQDPAVGKALALLASPTGRAIEQEVASLWLPPADAALLTDALTIAWKVIRDQNRPAWQRADALIAVGVLALVVVGVLAYANLQRSS